jgi:hypothetical protein
MRAMTGRIELEELRVFAERLADASRALIATAARSAIRGHVKGDGSPVTAIDQAVEDRLRTMIAGAYPDHGIVGEERGASSPERELVWVLDPIDGTLPFLAGIPVYGTLIALLRDRAPVIGVIEMPATGERWVGCRDLPTTRKPTLAAFAYRFSMGLPYSYPDNDLSYTGNFLNMMFKMVEPKYKPNPALQRALDVLFILHADHEQNCGTNAMRSVGSSKVDPYSATAAAAAALYGPLHGGANEQVLRMLNTIGSVDNIPSYVERVKNGEFRLMGFGHRVYKNYDPRANIIKQIADEVFDITGRNPLLDIALELEKIALEDEYFVSRKLYPNVDFYSGIIYQAMGLPVSMFPVLFAIPRTAGWLAQWVELLTDKEQAIARPRQVYLGEDERSLAPISER